MAHQQVFIEDLKGSSDEQLIRNYENITKEQEQYSKQLQYHEMLLDENKRRIKIVEKLHKISEEKNRMVEPQFEFHEDGEWIALQRELLKINNTAVRRGMEQEIEKLTNFVGGGNTELKRFEVYLPKLKKELDKRGVEYE